MDPIISGSKLFKQMFLFLLTNAISWETNLNFIGNPNKIPFVDS